MNVLVIAPHPDDEAIGCGGTLCQHAARGDRVAAVFLTSGELGLKHLPPDKARRTREREARNAGKILGLARLAFLRRRDWFVGEEIEAAGAALRVILKREAPALVYLPHEREWHPDHQAALRVLRAALRHSGVPTPELRAYEVWTPLAEFDHAEDITAEMPRKVRAIRAHRSQLGEFDYERAVRGLDAFRGALAGRCRYAEVFQTLPASAAR
jgi:LmbE family N-acetylglucosaminyl deacetylase